MPRAGWSDITLSPNLTASGVLVGRSRLRGIGRGQTLPHAPLTKPLQYSCIYNSNIASFDFLQFDATLPATEQMGL